MTNAAAITAKVVPRVIAPLSGAAGSCTPAWIAAAVGASEIVGSSVSSFATGEGVAWAFKSPVGDGVTMLSTGIGVGNGVGTGVITISTTSTTGGRVGVVGGLVSVATMVGGGVGTGMIVSTATGESVRLTAA
jgi:hypothetical protein